MKILREAQEDAASGRYPDALDKQLVLEHGKPLIFGADKKKGIRLNNLNPEVVEIGVNGITEKDLMVYDEKQDCLYGLHLGARGPTFTQYNAKGAAVKEIPLVGDPLPQDLGAAPLGPPAGLAAIDGDVFIVADGGVYLVDPTSGEVRKTSKDK